MWGSFGRVGTLALLPAVLAYIVDPGPKYPPTSGEVWPRPQIENKDLIYFTFDPGQFNVKVTKYNCTLLSKAIRRYSYVLRHLSGLSRRYGRGRRPRGDAASPQDRYYYGGTIGELVISLNSPCEQLPHMDMDEAYSLTVLANDAGAAKSGKAEISTSSVWGALRGLETFAQLFYLADNYKEVRVNATSIMDWPRHPHRGLMVDTARHYLSPTTLLAALDAMALNKLNVLHWHLVDDQSFPYQSDKFPDLSSKGAFDPSLVYTQSDIQTIVEYATERGIRVIPEFDVPAHTRSWGSAYLNLLTTCYEHGQPAGYGPLHPLRNSVYKMIRDLLSEAHERFPDRYMHLGGDEVDLDCWVSNPEIQQYMKDNNITTSTELYTLFMRRVLPMLPSGIVPVVWQEVFDENVPLPENTLIQVWKSGAVEEMIKILEAGHLVLYSSGWYLDGLSSTLRDFLSVDPRSAVQAEAGAELARGVRGGEAAMWGEMVDDTNFMTRVWPRASAAAERLWSAALAGAVEVIDLRRAEEHACRSRRRGLPAQPPAGPGYCLLLPAHQHKHFM